MKSKVKQKAISKLETALEAYFDSQGSVPEAFLLALDQCKWASDFVLRRAVDLLRESSASHESSPDLSSLAEAAEQKGKDKEEAE